MIFAEFDRGSHKDHRGHKEHRERIWILSVLFVASVVFVPLERIESKDTGGPPVPLAKVGLPCNHLVAFCLHATNA
ncbi:MAG: hypothetical protein JWN24_4200 [Phycisphaerales bacterium]|nr:hypothetical protein [Phycisphaerales bacterium]